MNSFKENGKLAGCLTAWWFWLLIVSLVIGGIYTLVSINLNRRIQMNSTGYISAQLDQMSKDMTQFARNNVDLAKSSDNLAVVKALKAQQAGIVSDIWNAYDQIPNESRDAIPQDINAFLSSHPRGWIVP
jgi:hypothetical protein